MDMQDQDPYDLGAGSTGDDEKLRQKIANERAIADFKWLMADVRGRRIVWRQLEESGVFASSYHPTAMQMAFNEGKRNDGIKLLAKVHEHCPDLYSTMMKEQQK